MSKLSEGQLFETFTYACYLKYIASFPSGVGGGVGVGGGGGGGYACVVEVYKRPAALNLFLVLC